MSTCANCHGDHPTQRCPDIRAALFAPARHPLAPPPIGMEYARILCHRLSRVVAGPAHVVNDHGHLIVALDEQICDGWWPRESVVYTADAATIAAL